MSIWVKGLAYLGTKRALDALTAYSENGNDESCKRRARTALAVAERLTCSPELVDYSPRSRFWRYRRRSASPLPDPGPPLASLCESRLPTGSGVVILGKCWVPPPRNESRPVVYVLRACLRLDALCSSFS
jgi:hypothetical protein